MSNIVIHPLEVAKLLAPILDIDRGTLKLTLTLDFPAGITTVSCEKHVHEPKETK
jgi:hypothetical protein